PPQTSVKSYAQLAGAFDANHLAGAATEATPFSVGYSRATSTAQTVLEGVTTVDAGGNVVVNSDATTETKARALTAVNAAPKEKQHPNVNANASVGLAIAVIDSNTTSKTLVQQDVQITAGGNATVQAQGDIKDEALAGVAVF